MKLIAAAIALLTCLLNPLFAQQKQLDSLVNVASKMKADTNKVNFLNAIAWEYKYGFDKTTKKVALGSIELSKKLKFHSGTAQAYKIFGILMDETGDIPKSIESYEKSIVYFKKANDEMGVAKSEANIGMLFRDMKRNNEAIEKFELSNKVFIANDFVYGQMMIYQNLSICYTDLKKTDLALSNIKKSYVLMKQLGEEDPNVYGNYANVFLAQENYDKAAEYYNKAIELNGGNYRGSTWVDNLGLSYYYQKQYDKALPLFIASIENSPYKYNTNVMTTYRHLADAYFQTNQLKKAYETQEMYIDIRDSVFSSENSKQLSELTKKYDSEKKRLKIKSLEEQKKIKDEQIKSEQLQKYFFAACMVVFIALGFWLFRLVKQKNKANATILEQKRVVEEQRNTLEHKNREILDSITYAKRLQDAILPAKNYWRNAFPESFVLYKPKDIVAGDFYWMEQVTLPNGEELLFFAAADCTGHGVPGAMVSVVCCNALNRSVLEFGITDPGKILDKSRELVISTFEKSSENVMDGMDISLCCLNKNTLELQWAGANNPLWYNPKNSDEIIEIKPNKQPIGSYFELKDFTTHSIILEKGTTIYLFTDGYADQFGGRDGKKFKYKQFKESLLGNTNIDMTKQMDHLLDVFETWKGDLEQVDDVCVIGIQV